MEKGYQILKRRRSLKNNFIILLLLIGVNTWSFNGIHDLSSYSLLPRGVYSGPYTFGVGTYFTPGQSQINIPMSFSFTPTRGLELGAGLKSRWVNTSSNFPWLIFGLKYKLTSHTLLTNVLLGTSSSTSNGLSVGLYRHQSMSSHFSYRYQAKLGFLKALTDDSWMAFELEFYPTLKIFNPVSLEFGIITSSQANEFEDHFALDFQPGILVGIGRQSQVVTTVAIGGVGSRQENFRVQMVIQKTL